MWRYAWTCLLCALSTCTGCPCVSGYESRQTKLFAQATVTHCILLRMGPGLSIFSQAFRYSICLTRLFLIISTVIFKVLPFHYVYLIDISLIIRIASEVVHGKGKGCTHSSVSGKSVKKWNRGRAVGFLLEGHRCKIKWVEVQQSKSLGTALTAYCTYFRAPSRCCVQKRHTIACTFTGQCVVDTSYVKMFYCFFLSLSAALSIKIASMTLKWSVVAKCALVSPE